MDQKTSLPIAGGIGAAAVLTFFLSPWVNQTNTAPPAPASTPSVAASSTNTTATYNRYSLSQNEQGPWYALCKAFSTVDPEDLETNANHPIKPAAGVDVHPPLHNDAEYFPEEIKEETVLEGRIQRKFTPQYHYKADIASCLPPKDPSAGLNLTYIIATIPDPLGSHLSLQFDRNVVAIERAAEANGFGFERYWFPWSGLQQTQLNERDIGLTDTLKQQLRDQPGLLMFRKFTKPGADISSIYSPRLLVFLVGETPTAGLNKIAFTKAARYIVQLDCRLNGGPQCADANNIQKGPDPGPCNLTTKVKVLGPNFSASFSPLYRALEDLRTLARDRLCISADILSPTTTVEAQRNTFKEEIDKQHLGSFTPLAPTDCRTEMTMLAFLRELGYHIGEVAYLSEDETSYSPGTLEKQCTFPGISTLTYPRDLSALRNMWQPTVVSVTPADISGQPVRSQIVPFSLHEQSSNELDSPVAFATEQAAPDIDQALSNITSTIRHLRYRVIIVTASNPLDEVYLLQYLRHNVPDVRLATYDQDLLMLRVLNFEALRGTISVTSFPLVNTLLLQTEVGETDTSAFPNSGAVATFIGMNLLIDDSISRSPLVSYLGYYPGTYVLGNDAFWTVRKARVPLSMMSDKEFTAPWVWYIIMVALLGVVGSHLFRYRKLYLPHRTKKSLKTPAGLLQSMQLKGGRRNEDLAQDYFLLVGNNQLLILLFLIAVPSIVIQKNLLNVAYDPSVSTISTLGILLFKRTLFISELVMCVLLLCTSILLLVRALRTASRLAQIGKPDEGSGKGMDSQVANGGHAGIRMRGENGRRKLDFKQESEDKTIGITLPIIKGSGHLGDTDIVTSSDFIIVAIYPLVTMAVAAYAFLADWANISLTAYRAVYVMDGLSPIPVIAAVIAVWYFFSVIGIRAVKTIKAMRVDPLFLASSVPSCSAAWVRALGGAQQKLLVKVESLVKADAKGGILLFATFAVFFALRGWQALRGVDNWLLRDWIVFGGVGLLTASIVIQWFRIWSIWVSLRTLLAILSASPLSTGFENIPKELTSVKIWRSFERLPSLALQSNTLRLLRRVRDESAPTARASLTPYLETAECHVNNLSYRIPLAEDTSLHDHTLLNVCFDACIAPSIGDDVMWFQKRSEEGDRPVIDYIALRYVALIKYVNSQVRWLLAFVLYGYVVLILGVRAYPFQGQHTIASILTITFSVMFLLAAILFVQMDSNPLLSTLEHSTPGKANYFEAALRLLSVGGIPLIAVLASQFPAIEQFAFSWIKPTIDSLH
ncbi:hypothetical protein [Alloacidobacterium sp.]|uniref:hypothetical protein n=1 Tax=Alloacidobacterium sp. TaxID=2951999 RepID=UPI002D5F763F|nr:hypothetical protein [Alloacidobacterium sp.]HYK37848.1 hypothetical protein [Alloacidobacterium sp.]